MPEKSQAQQRDEQVREIVRQVLENDSIEHGEEPEELAIARNIISLVDRLKASLPDWAPDQERHLTGIRAAAHQLIRMRSLGTNAENLPGV
jgi:non-homologous end joining protein Ku